MALIKKPRQYDVFVFVRDIDKLSKTDVQFNLDMKGIELEYKKSNKTEAQKIYNELFLMLFNKFENVFKDDNNKLEYIKVSGHRIYFKEKPSKGGTVPTPIQEEGTTFIFNQVLDSKKVFKDEKSLRGDAAVMKELKKIFTPQWEHRINDWLHTYYEQQKTFFEKFSSNEWSKFEYGDNDFIDFLNKEVIPNVVRITKGKEKKINKYSEWNPSDIWAVKDKKEVQRQIKDALKSEDPSSLSQLNAKLVKLIADGELIGLSLKKLKPTSEARFIYVNMDDDTKKILKLEDPEVKMNNIEFDIKLDIDASYVYFMGKSGQYKIIIEKSGSSKTPGNLSFGTLDKSSGGRGGQAPIKMVLNRIGKSSSFTNNHRDYPKTQKEFNEKYEGKYKKYFDYLSKKKHLSGDNFKNEILELYRKNSNLAVSKLMQIHFFYETLNKYSDNPDFWKDLLYYGMKIGSGFAPHGKLY